MKAQGKDGMKNDKGRGKVRLDITTVRSELWLDRTEPNVPERLLNCSVQTEPLVKHLLWSLVVYRTLNEIGNCKLRH